MSGIDTLIDLGFIDDTNLFVAGGSAGGIATAYAVGLTDRFNAAVAAKHRDILQTLFNSLRGNYDLLN